MARRIGVEIIGDSDSVERAFRRASASATGFQRDVETSSKRVSLAFSGIGRSVAAVTAGFAAVDVGFTFLKSSIDEARDAEKSQRSLAAQLRANGESFRLNRAAVERASLSYAKFGEDNDDVVKSLTILDRATGNINRSIALQGDVVALAKAKNLDLAKAAAIVAKAVAGQDTALRRAVPGLSAGAHGIDLVREAGQKLAGQAAANTTSSDKFNASLKNFEEVVGRALTPVVDHYLDSGSKWLDQMSRSGELQKDVTRAVNLGTDALHAIDAVVSPLADAFEALSDAVGGTENAFKLLAGVALAAKLSSLADSVGLIGKNAAMAKTETSLLAGNLNKLKLIGAITIPIEILANGKAIQNFASKHGLGFLNPSGASDLKKLFAALQGGGTSTTDPRIAALLGQKPSNPLFAALDGLLGTGGTRPGGGRLGIPAARGSIFTGAQPLTAAQTRALGLAANPDDLKLLQQQAAHDRAAIAFAQKLRARGAISTKKYVAEVLAYRADLNATLAHITEITKSAADQVKRLAIPAASGSVAGFRLPLKIPRASGSTQFLAEDFRTPASIELAAARAQALGNQKGILAAARAERNAAQKAIDSGRLSIQAMTEAYQTISRANQTLKDGLDQDLASFKKASPNSRLRGLGLTAEQRRALRARFSQPLGISTARGAFGVVTPTAPINVNLNLDGRTIHKVVIDREQTRRRRNPVQKRGPNAGR